MNSEQASLITKETIQLDLDVDSKFDAIRSLCGQLFAINKTENPSLLYQDVIKREETVSTFAGSETAIPHAITKHVSEPVLSFARISNDNFTWDGNDEKVQFVFLLAAPFQEDLKQLRQSQSYIFSSVAQLISQVEILELWATAKEKQVILDSLSSAFEIYQNT
ncbi:MAG: PTS sugar transporter subunit IIA [Sedimenticola sp.]